MVKKMAITNTVRIGVDSRGEEKRAMDEEQNRIEYSEESAVDTVEQDRVEESEGYRIECSAVQYRTSASV